MPTVVHYQPYFHVFYHLVRMIDLFNRPLKARNRIVMGISDNLFRPPDIWGFVACWPCSCKKGGEGIEEDMWMATPVGGGRPMFLLCTSKPYYGIYLYQWDKFMWRNNSFMRYKIFTFARQGMSTHNGLDTCLVLKGYGTIFGRRRRKYETPFRFWGLAVWMLVVPSTRV